MKKSIKSTVKTIVTITLATLCVACNPAPVNAAKEVAKIETTATGTLTTYTDGTGYYKEKVSNPTPSEDPAIPVITETVNNNLYPLTGLVTKVTPDADKRYDTVMIVCCNGNIFEFSAPHSDCWDVYDIASCIMDNNETECVEDDKVLSALYAGSIEQLREKMG